MTVTCKHCGDKGVVFETQEDGLPITRRCICVLQRDVLDNLEQKWGGLSTAPKVSSTPLKGMLGSNVWVTSNVDVFRSHFRHLAVRQGPDWDFKVASDANLMSSWLASAVLQGMKTLDGDVAEVSSVQDITLYDLVYPSPFLVLLLGVKRARNAAMPEVLLEALQLRAMAKKPTWVVDQPEAPLNDTHLCYSATLMHLMANWQRIYLETPLAAPLGLVPARFIHPTVPVEYRTNSPEAALQTLDEIMSPRKKPRKK